MTDLARKAFTALSRFLLALAGLLFLSSWTLRYWQAWLFLAVFSISVVAITLYLARNDPKLLERRMNAGPSAEKERHQRVIQLVASISFIAIFMLSAIDHRLGWSTVPSLIVATGNFLVGLGLFLILLTFRQNTFASA